MLDDDHVVDVQCRPFLDHWDRVAVGANVSLRPDTRMRCLPVGGYLSRCPSKLIWKVGGRWSPEPGQGVGRAIALTLADAGADVAINDVVDSRPTKWRDEIRERGGRPKSAPFDVTDWESVDAAVERLGGIGHPRQQRRKRRRGRLLRPAALRRDWTRASGIGTSG